MTLSKIVITTPEKTAITATRLPITIKPAKFNVKISVNCEGINVTVVH